MEDKKTYKAPAIEDLEIKFTVLCGKSTAGDLKDELNESEEDLGDL